MPSSPVSFLGLSVAAFGSTIANTTGSFYNGNFGALSTVGGSGFSLAAISGFGITDISAITGVTFSAPNQFLGHITSFRLSSGICQAINQLHRAPPLSNDTSLSLFSVEGIDVTDGGMFNFNAGLLGAQTNIVAVIPAHPSATIGTITFNNGSLETGDNLLEFDVTAEDLVTVQHYNVTLRVLTEGVAEVTDIIINNNTTGITLITASDGRGFIISSSEQTYGVWFNTGTETQPDFSGMGVTAYLEVLVEPSFDEENIMTALYSTLVDTGEFTSSYESGTQATFTNVSPAACTDAVDVDSGLSFNTVTQGEGPS